MGQEVRHFDAALSFDEAGECSTMPTRFDWKDVGISLDEGATYTILNDCAPLTDGIGTPIDHIFDISAFAGQEVWIVFVYDTFDRVVGHAFAIDDVAITVDGVPGQSDADGDGVGDWCDGRIELDFVDTEALHWDLEQGFDRWNLYRGDLSLLLADGLYTQEPGSNPVAARQCGLELPAFSDGDPPPSGTVAFYLVSGSAGLNEGGLGGDSSGTPRSNTNPCP